jgi:hypothetical protein
MRGHEKGRCSLETISFPIIVKEAENRQHGMCSVCMTDKDTKNAVNSISDNNVCARTALTDSSSNKQQLQETIIIHRNFIHI